MAGLTQRGDEDFSSSTEKVVQRIRDPDTEQSGRNVRGSIDETDNPLVSVSCSGTDLMVEPEFSGERQV
jgi:hypothetical protein